MNASRLVCGVAVLTVAASLAGCSSGGGDGGSNSDLGVQVEKNRSMWVMPLDAYMVDQQLDNAVDVLVEPCMQESGFAYQRAAIDITQRSETVTVSGRNLFNVDVAKKWGYGGAPDPNGDLILAAEAQTMSWPPEEQEQYDECMREAREEFPAQTINNYVAGLALSSWSGALRDPEVVAAAKDWVQCMQPLGFTDLPDSPNSESGGTPTQSMSDAYGEVADGVTNVQTPEQEAEEIRIATFDAECQESSGYAQALYDAEWERQVATVRENEPALTALLDEKAAYEEKADKIFREAGLG